MMSDRDMKVCKKCNKNLHTHLFYKDKKYKDGYNSWCKNCHKEYSNKKYQKNKDHIVRKNKEYYENNKEIIKNRRSAYYYNNKNSLAEMSKAYYRKNKETIRKRHSEYKLKNIEAERIRNKRWYSINKDKILQRHNERYEYDIIYKIKYALRNRFKQAFRKTYKRGSAIEHLGCSIEELKKHLESQFQPGMTWDNYGEWHIDHIVPFAKFDMIKLEDQQKACHYTNLQPLWAKDNLKKGAR